MWKVGIKVLFQFVIAISMILNMGHAYAIESPPTLTVSASSASAVPGDLVTITINAISTSEVIDVRATLSTPTLNPVLQGRPQVLMAVLTAGTPTNGVWTIKYQIPNVEFVPKDFGAWSFSISGSSKTATSIKSILNINVNSPAPPQDCPDAWGIGAPHLAIARFDGLSNGVPYQFFDSSLGGVDNSSTNQRGGIEKLSDDQDIHQLSKIDPSLFWKLYALGPNVVWKSSYESSGPGNESTFTPRYLARLNSLFKIPVHTWELRYIGLENGSSITWHLSIDVKGCSHYELKSNPAILEGLTEKQIDSKFYFDHFPTASNGALIDFQQQDLILKTISLNISALESSVSPNALQLQQTSGQLGAYFDYLFMGLEPSGCIDSINPNSSPAVNPRGISLNTTPCKVGVFFPAHLTEELVCETSTCQLPTNSADLIKLLKIQHYTDSWAYDFVLVNTFTLKAREQTTPTPTISPTPPTPTATSKVPAPPSAKSKTKTIQCLRGKILEKVTALNPKCPHGYKEK